MKDKIKLIVIMKENSGMTLRLSAVNRTDDEGSAIPLTPECSTVEEFEQAVQALKFELENRIEEARTTFRHSPVSKEAQVMEPQSTEEIWQAMERSGSIHRMKEIFNGLALERRKEVANFIFTRMNIFKGAALAFSQGYNEEQGILE